MPPLENIGVPGIIGIVVALVALYFLSCIRVLFEYGAWCFALAECWPDRRDRD